jgi:hypothetical protein
MANTFIKIFGSGNSSGMPCRIAVLKSIDDITDGLGLR